MIPLYSLIFRTSPGEAAALILQMVKQPREAKVARPTRLWMAEANRRGLSHGAFLWPRAKIC